MKNLIILLILLITLTAKSFAQPNKAIRQIKVGNTYRETNQFKEAELALLSGLNSIRQQKDKYWEAVACENLGLLYRDIEDSLQAARYFDSAINIYERLGLNGSKTAMQQLAQSIRKTGEQFAGIDIGSTGVKLSIIQVSLGREGRYIYNIIKDSAINANFADLNSSSFEATKNAITKLLTIINQKNIPHDNIFIAFSSGVLQEAINKKLNTDSISNIFGQVAESVIPDFKPRIKFLNADMEARYANIGIVLPKYKERSVSIDIGGGNTKGGYYNNTGVFESFSLPFGSRFLTITPQDTTLPAKLKSELTMFNQRPGIQNKREVFFLGGIVWAMINLVYPEKALSDYVEFTYTDVMDFKKLASADYINLINYSTEKVNRITDIETASAAQKNLIATQNTFTAENLRRGAMLLAGIMNELQIPTLKKRYYFLSKGSHIAWVTGYIVSNISEKYKNAKE
ncbi:MAG: hypothetical protein WKF59_23990 [Chitinophagaceae bacterium]